MKRIILTLFLTTYVAINAQVPFCVAPLNVGNTWVYRDVTSPTPTWRTVYQVIDSTAVFNNHQYSVIKTYETSERHKPQNISYSYILCRYDSTDNSYLYFDQTSKVKYPEYKYYKRGSVPGERWIAKNPLYHNGTLYSTVVDTATIRIFQKAVLLTRYIIATDSLVSNSYEYWTDELGMIKRGEDGVLFYLYGCVINGVLYGDTLRTFTDVVKDKPSYPDNFRLYQNYPNPFNPSTKIKYFIPYYTFVNLKICNILGKEIKTLVNEYKEKGIYETAFDADDLPSGTYICVLISDKYKDVIKLTLLK